MLDLHFADQSVFKLFDTFYVSDDFGSDHSSNITTLNIVTQSEFDLKTKINSKKFNQIVRQEYENSVLYPPVYPKAELNQLNELLVQIIQFSLQKSYILQKDFPLEMKLLNLSGKRRKKENKRAEKNKRRTVQIPEKGNKFSPKRNKEVHETIGKNQTIKIYRKCSK